MNPAYRCPTCGSDDTATLAATHAHGTSRSAGLLVGEVGGRLGLGGLAGTTATDAAAAAAPPEPMPADGAWSVFMVGCTLVAVALLAHFLVPAIDRSNHPKNEDFLRTAVCVLVGVLGAVVAAVSLLLWLRWKSHNATVHRVDLDRWRRTWACRRCGGRFVP